MEKCRAAYERNKKELLEIKEFLDTHDLEAVEKRFNTIERCFAHIKEIISPMTNVQFDFFIPPHCAIIWVCMDDQEVRNPTGTRRGFNDYIGGILYILNKIEASPNIRLYAFDDVAEITGNTANFFDDRHYGIGVNRYILKSIKAGKHRITKANVLEYLRRMADVLVHFDPAPNLEYTVSFEGPLTEASEKAFSSFPPPTGPSPLEL
jgi:hypothetical protein